LQQYVGILPKYLVRRFISADQNAVVVTGRVPDIDASQIRPIVNSLNRALDGIRVHDPGYRISVTSLAAVAARNSATMIEKLNRGLTVEAVFVAAFIGVAFRSVQAMLASILPAVFPIVVAGTLLWALGDGLQFASVVALTVSFGLGLSATIHFPQSAASRGAVRRWFSRKRQTRHHSGWTGIDSHIRSAFMRTDGHGVLQFAGVEDVWLAQFLCDGSRARGRSDHPASDG